MRESFFPPLPLKWRGFQKGTSVTNTSDTRKITSPILPASILYRESLINYLHESTAGPALGLPHYKLILLHAPAGYGKTTLLADFARHTQLPCCWYLLENTDTDKITFLKYLITSIRLRFPSLNTVLDSLLTNALATNNKHRYEAVIDALIATIEEDCPERFAIILCNYQEVNEYQEINDLLNYLLRKLPTKCVLIIDSRATPDLEFASLLARREMIGMGSAFLQFHAQEIYQLAQLQGKGQMTLAEAKQLVDAFEGWITGILLSSHLSTMQLLRQSHDASLIMAHQGIETDRQYLFSYVVNEVFRHHPQVYSFLKEASILLEMTPSLCSQILNVPDAYEHLQYLEQNGLFVTHSGEGTQISYVCHPVLRELFSSELHHQAPERFRALHHRAALFFQETDDYRKAIYHAKEAKEHVMVAELIITAHEQMMDQGNIETLTWWIDSLPTYTLACYPKLPLLRAKIYLLAGDHTNALSLLDQVEQSSIHQSLTSDEQAKLLFIEQQVLRSQALFQRGRYDQVNILCEQMLKDLPSHEIKTRAEVHTRLGVCSNLQGNYTVGIEHLQKALQLLGRHTMNHRTAEIHGALASTYSLLGNFSLAEHHITRAISYGELLHDEWGKINNITRLALIKQRQGAFDDAESAFNEALNLARKPTNFLRGQAYALVNLGVLHQQRTFYEKSLEAIENGLALARQVEDKYLINYALCMLSTTYLYMGDASTALLLLSEVSIPDPKNTSLPGYEQAIYELVYGTILFYQQRYTEAYPRLLHIQASFNTMGLKSESLQAAIRLSACQLELQQISDCAHRMQWVAKQSKVKNGYEHLVLSEVQRLPTLQRAIETLPEMAAVRNLIAPTSLVPEVRTPVDQKQQIAEGEALQVLQVTTPQPKITIQAFGEPLVSLQDRPITRWRMARSMELFFFLLNCGKPMRKEQIITALWSEVDEQINQTFHSTVYYLRKALETPCIITQGSLYTLDLPSHYGPNISYDVAAFLDYQSKAKQAFTQDDKAYKEALLSMVNLYHGQYVQSFYSDWCILQRDNLQHAYLDARNQLAQIAWHEDQFDESIDHLQQILTIDNCYEEAHYWLMRCYLRQGKRGLALRQYQRCRETLSEELGTEPGSAIQTLYQRSIHRG
ncbi:hypothetical protein KTT_47680 [Tengunoibacter tsumagoiensis]|uniref:Bacterial transcriptional activator domain-containing protein n=1 Tax=Tengunoibacter tsumagoiensis TaxID=2014871 RepID=A0A402A741_9CHLR|nr:hypothetical protein KTT_47680 [Tengunoibacter tsumagoiensis]